MGSALEESEPALFAELWGGGVYAQHERYDMQGVCLDLPPPDDSAAFRSVVPPLLFDLLSLRWWSSTVTWAYVNFNLAQWLHELTHSLTHLGNASRVIRTPGVSLAHQSCH